MKPKLLITNDDGIQADGLYDLWKCLHPYYSISIVAPHIEQSGCGLGITLRKPLRIQEEKWEHDTPAWSVTGTPADCVKMAISLILEEKPDLIVSGINDESNAGRNILYSGTVGGIIEGTLRGIPGVAFSCLEWKENAQSLAADYIPKIIDHLLMHPLPTGTLLNVNFPTTLTHHIKGLKLARQGKSYYLENLKEDTDHNGDTVHWLGGKYQKEPEPIDSEIHLLNEGYATAVPIHVEELTDFKDLEKRKQAFNEIFETVS